MPPFQLEPDEVRAAADTMAETAENISDRMSIVVDRAESLGDAVDAEAFPGVAAVAELTAEWAQVRVRGDRDSIEELSEALRGHVDDMGDTDEHNAGTFDEHRL